VREWLLMKGSKECKNSSQVLHQNFLQRTEKNDKSLKLIQPASKLLTPIFSKVFYTNWSYSVWSWTWRRLQKVEEEDSRRWKEKFCTSVTCQDGVYAFWGKAARKRNNSENDVYVGGMRGRRTMTTRTRQEG